MANKRYRNESRVLQLVQVDGEYVRVAPGETIVADERSQIPSIQGFVLVNSVEAKAPQAPEKTENTGLHGNDNDTPAEAQRTSRHNRR